jgi:hypothetical protein
MPVEAPETLLNSPFMGNLIVPSADGAHGFGNVRHGNFFATDETRTFQSYPQMTQTDADDKLLR